MSEFDREAVLRLAERELLWAEADDEERARARMLVAAIVDVVVPHLPAGAPAEPAAVLVADRGLEAPREAPAAPTAPARRATAPAQEPSFRCADCGKGLANRSGLGSHVGRVHSTMQVECHACGQQFMSGAGFAAHVRSHGNVTDLPPAVPEQEPEPGPFEAARRARAAQLVADPHERRLAFAAAAAERHRLPEVPA